MARYKVLGFKRFKGTIDGNAIDSAKLYVECKLDSSRNSQDQRSAGYCTEEVRVAPELLKAVEHTPCPFLVDLDTERVTNGRQSRDLVVGIRLVEEPKQEKLKAA